MLAEELIPNLNLETQNIEFKGIIEEGPSDSGKNKELGWLKTLASFANTDGGDMFIGIEDKSHTVVALEHSIADKIVLMVHRIVEQRVEPHFEYEIHPIPVPKTMPTRYVLRIHVQRSKSLPVMIHENGLLGIYVRQFGRTIAATSEQVREMIYMSENIPYDTIFTNQAYKSECFSAVAIRAEETDTALTEKALISKGIISANGMLSKGALLFADQCNDVITKMTATCWPGVDKGSSVILASDEYIGNLIGGIEWAVSFVKSHSVSGFRKEDDGRSDYVAYPARSVLEGIVNAAAHRNYYMQGTQIEINIYKDRLEITSPGSLLGVRELHHETNISSVIPRRRNEVICNMLEILKYMESKGSGFDKIEADYKAADESHKPYISSDGTSFTLTLPDLTFIDGVMELSDKIPNIHTDCILDGKNDSIILGYCYRQYRSVKEIAACIGVAPSTYFRKNVIDRLVQQQLLKERKLNRSSEYISNTDKVFL